MAQRVKAIVYYVSTYLALEILAALHHHHYLFPTPTLFAPPNACEERTVLGDDRWKSFVNAEVKDVFLQYFFSLKNL